MSNPPWPRRETVGPVWIAADFHLAGHGRGLDAFRELLLRAAAASAQLYLLGDVFDAWYGPKHMRLDMYREELAALTAATTGGLSISIVPGNRDFLLETTFSERTGVEILGDAIELVLTGSNGRRHLHLSHGDLLATSDVRYQRMRRVLRWRIIPFLARALPEFLVRKIAARLRRHSENVVPKKSLATLEPDLSVVKSYLAHGCNTVVCGHFHRYRDEEVELEEGSGRSSGRFIIVEPFEDRGFYLVHDGECWSEHRLSVESTA